MEQEPGSGGKESAEFTIRNLAGYQIRAERVTGDKLTRAKPLAAQTEAGNVYLVAAAWNEAFLAEAHRFNGVSGVAIATLPNRKVRQSIAPNVALTAAASKTPVPALRRVTVSRKSLPCSRRPQLEPVGLDRSNRLTSRVERNREQLAPSRTASNRA